MKIKNGLFALTLFVLVAAGVVNGQTQTTYSLFNGDSLTPASSFVDTTGVKTFFGGFINGQVAGTSPATFTFSVAFTELGPVDGVPGVYSGSILSPNSSFAVTQSVGRKSVSTSGTIDAGTVTYRLTAEGRADLISIVSSNLTIWEGKNKSRRAVGNGTVDYGTSVEGSGTIVLNRF